MKLHFLPGERHRRPLTALALAAAVAAARWVRTTDPQLGPSLREGSAGVRHESRPAAGADLTGSLTVRPDEKGRRPRGARGDRRRYGWLRITPLTFDCCPHPDGGTE